MVETVQGATPLREVTAWLLAREEINIDNKYTDTATHPCAARNGIGTYKGRITAAGRRPGPFTFNSPW